MLKKIISFILMGIIVFSLVGCGSRENLIEMQDNEALSVLQLKVSKIDIVPEGSNGRKYYDGTARLCMNVYFDIDIKDEYKKDYKLKEILSYELNNEDFRKWDFESGMKYSMEKDKAQIIVEAPRPLHKMSYGYVFTAKWSHQFDSEPTDAEIRDKILSEKDEIEYLQNTANRIGIIKHIRVSLNKLK